MDVMKFIAENMYVLVVVLYVLGMLLKNTPNIKDWMIPYVLLVIGIVLALGIGGFNFESLIQGVLVTGATVLANQLKKQFPSGN
jgi:hypothetical protein